MESIRLAFFDPANKHFLLVFCITWLHIRIHLDFCVRSKKSTVSSNPTTGFWLHISDTSWPNNSCKSKTIWRIVLWNLIIYPYENNTQMLHAWNVYLNWCKIATFKGKWLGKYSVPWSIWDSLCGKTHSKNHLRTCKQKNCNQPPGKNISQIGSFPPVGVKNKTISNHRLQGAPIYKL